MEGQTRKGALYGPEVISQAPRRSLSHPYHSAGEEMVAQRVQVTGQATQMVSTRLQPNQRRDKT